MSPIAAAQQPDPPPAAPQPGDLLQARRWFQGGNAGRDVPLLIETSPPIANLLTRAEDGVARRDWKLAIDSLQRVIDDRAGTLVPRDDGAMEGGLLFESAGRLAMRRLASLPPEGLLAYRVLFDGKAKGLFDRAKTENDRAALRAVADRFLLTRYGDNAADLLASRALDDGRLTEVVALLNDLLNFVPDNDIPPDRVYGKLAIAYTLMGFPARASEIIHEYRSRSGGKTEPPSEISDLKSEISEFESEISTLDAWVRRTHDLMVSRRASDVGGQHSARVGPQVFPTLMEHVPWRYDLEGVAADLWRRIINDDPGIPPPIPRNDIVADGGGWPRSSDLGDRLYVRVPGGCAALDIVDLTVVWRSPTDAAFRPVIQQTFTGRGQPPMTFAAPVGPYSDDPSNTLSTALGLVFTIEKFGAGEFTDRDEVAGQSLLFIRQPVRNVRGATNGTRLVAYDGRTGAVRWQRGRTDNSRDLLGDVRFLSAPIAVGDAVWVPYLQGADVYVGVLRPADGAVLRTILLGSVREPPDAGEPTTPPTLSDGVVYIPTGFGALYAVDADSMALRWAALYDTRTNAGRVSNAHPTAPPVVSGGVVLLAPTDFAEVMAFDAATGEYRWSDIAEGCSYLIAADQGRVWLGGRRITCRQLADGQTLWTTHLLGVPTGKAVVCGEVVHVPTSDGLISLDALSGTIRGQQAVPASQPPLGNLACINTGLFSLDPSSLREFPDVERMHAAATALLRDDPKNPTAAVQLAWAELLQSRPQRAYDAVAALPAEVVRESEKKRSAVARVTVEALLTLAGQAPSPDEALRLLRKADESAVSAASRLRCRSAIADQLAALGRNLEAHRGLLAVGLSIDADEMIELDDGVTAVARFEIARRLRRLHDRLTADELRTIEAQTARRIETLAKQLREERDSRTARDELLALADLHFPSAIGVRALYELADWEIDQRLFERAEQRLRKCIRSAADPMWTAAAYVRLCQLYAESEEDAVGLLVQNLDELDARFGSLAMPTVSGQSPSFPRGAAPRVGVAHPTAPRSSERIGDWVAKMRSRIPTEKLPTALPAMYGETPTPGPAFSLAGRYAWTYDPPDEADPARFVLFEQVPPRAMIDRIVVFGRDGFLECISADRKELLWRTRLRLPGAFADIPPDFGQRIPNIARSGVAEGQTAVLNGPEGIFAVGLLTGRLLWVKPFDRSVLDVAGVAARDPMTAVRDGLLAAMPRDGRLTLMRLADGSTIWERDLRGESVARIWLHENSAVFADDAMKRVHILDRESGRLIQRILLRQPDPEHERIDLVQADGMLYGPDSTGPGDGVAAFDLQSGERRWRVDLDKPVVALFEPKAGYLGIGLLNGDLRIVSAATGEVVLERSDPSVRAVIGGVMWDGTLILRCAGVHGPRQGNELAAFDIATGAEVWRRRDATALMPGDAPLSIIGGVIPAIVAPELRPSGRGADPGRTDVNPPGAATPRGGAAITLIDARTGADAGTAVDLNAAMQGATLNGDMGFWPNVLVIGTIKGIHAVRVETAEPAAGRDF
jgi:outer membrane protein assembly factor BamB